MRESGLQGQAAFLGTAMKVIAAVRLLRPLAHIQRQCFLTVRIGTQLDTVLVGQLLDAGQAQGILAGNEHFDAVHDGAFMAVLAAAEQRIHRQRVVIGHHEVDAAAAADQVVVAVVDDDVVTVTGIDGVPALAAVDEVIAAAAEDQLVTVTAEEDVVTIRTVQDSLGRGGPGMSGVWPGRGGLAHNSARGIVRTGGIGPQRPIRCVRLGSRSHQLFLPGKGEVCEQQRRIVHPLHRAVRQGHTLFKEGEDGRGISGLSRGRHQRLVGRVRPVAFRRRDLIGQDRGHTGQGRGRGHGLNAVHGAPGFRLCLQGCCGRTAVHRDFQRGGIAVTIRSREGQLKMPSIFLVLGHDPGAALLIQRNVKNERIVRLGKNLVSIPRICDRLFPIRKPTLLKSLHINLIGANTVSGRGIQPAIEGLDGAIKLVEGQGTDSKVTIVLGYVCRNAIVHGRNDHGIKTIRLVNKQVISCNIPRRRIG